MQEISITEQGKMLINFRDKLIPMWYYLDKFYCVGDFVMDDINSVDIREIMKQEKTIDKTAEKVHQIIGCDYDTAYKHVKDYKKQYDRNLSNSIILFVLGLLFMLPKYYFGTILFFALAYMSYPDKKNKTKTDNKTENTITDNPIQIEQDTESIKLINCPCCGKEISNKAEVCIHCGQPIKQENESFNGVYRYFLGMKQEVRCPRCASENCSHYQEQKIVPGKTKTRYTANLNPLRPFTLANKKEKVVKKDKYITESKFICNSCGKIFW